MEVDASRRALLGLRADSASLPPRASIGDQCLNTRGVICDACKDVCDVRAIVRVRSSSRIGALAVNAELCTGCGHCVGVCPSNAIAMSSTMSAERAL